MPLVLMFIRTFLNAVPASAPLMPFFANTSVIAAASFNCTPALAAAVPATCNVAATSEIGAVPFCALLANISTTCADSEADTSNWAIVAVRAFVASLSSILLAFDNKIADLETCSMPWLSLSNSGSALPTNAKFCATSVYAVCVSSPTLITCALIDSSAFPDTPVIAPS